MASVGLLMIVKNGEATLRRCLESVSGIVDEMVIGDTGSTDCTTQIATSMGAKVLPLEWNGDYSQARNQVLSELQTDWVLTMDADEELPPESAEWIRSAVTVTGVDAYLTQVRNYLSPELPPAVDQIMLEPEERHSQAPEAMAYFPSACCRLFRRQEEVRYRGCVHEMVDYDLQERGAVVRLAAFTIHHFGWYLADALTIARKRATYRELLARKLEKMPDDTNTLVRYALLLAEDADAPEEALAYTRRAAELEPAADGAWLFTGMILRRLGRYEEALAALDQVPPHDQPAFRAQLRGDALHGLGRLAEARSSYVVAHTLAPRDRHVASKLGFLEVREGDCGQGLQRLQQAAEQHPPVLTLYAMLVNGYISAGRPVKAAAEAERLAASIGSAEAWLQFAKLYAQLADWREALRLLELGILQFPEADELHNYRIYAAVALGDLHTACEAAARVAELTPTPRALLRHAALLSQIGEQSGLERVLQNGAQLFPGSPLLHGLQNTAVSADPAGIGY